MSSFCHVTVYLERALVPFKKDVPLKKGVFWGFSLNLKTQRNAQHLWKQTIVQKIPS